MTTRFVAGVLAAIVMTAGAASGQVPALPGALSARYVDPANGVSLEQAIERAIQQAPGLRATRTGVEIAKGMRTQAGVWRNPSISFEQRTEPGGMDRLSSLSVEWPLELFRRSGRTAVAEGELKAVELEVANSERLLAAEVRARYGEVLEAVRELAILDELVATTSRQHELLRARVEEGASPALDRDLVELELRRLESDRALQVGRADVAMIELRRTLGLAPDAPLLVRATLDVQVALDASSPPDAVSSRDAQPRADVQQAEARIGIADARIGQLEREARPDASLFGSYMRMNSGFPQRGLSADDVLEPVRAQFNYVSIGVVVSVPILNRNQGELAAARAGRAGAVAEFDAAKLMAEAEAAAARVQAQHAAEAVALYRDRAGALARQNLSVVTQSYELGRMTVFDVLAEQRRFFDVERAYTAALRAAYEARTALVRALGGVR